MNKIFKNVLSVLVLGVFIFMALASGASAPKIREVAVSNELYKELQKERPNTETQDVTYKYTSKGYLNLLQDQKLEITSSDKSGKAFVSTSEFFKHIYETVNRDKNIDEEIFNKVSEDLFKSNIDKTKVYTVYFHVRYIPYNTKSQSGIQLDRIDDFNEEEFIIAVTPKIEQEQKRIKLERRNKLLAIQKQLDKQFKPIDKSQYQELNMFVLMFGGLVKTGEKYKIEVIKGMDTKYGATFTTFTGGFADKSK